MDNPQETKDLYFTNLNLVGSSETTRNAPILIYIKNPSDWVKI